MKSLRIETGIYGWINRFVLTKDSEGFILKVMQYKLKNKGEKQGEFREIHIWENNSVEKLRDFLVANIPKRTK